MPAPQPRPLSIGETLDLALRICVRRFRPLVKTVFFIVAPVSLVTSVVELWVLPAGFLNQGGSGSTNHVTMGDLRSAVGGLALITLLGALGSLLASAACFRIVADACLGRTTDWTVSVRYALARLPAVLWVTLLEALAILVGLVFCVLPGLWLAVMFSVAVPALLTEGHRGPQALGRSRALVKGRFWPVVGTLIVGTVVAGVVSIGITSIGAPADPTTSIGFVIQWAVQTGASTLATPIVAAVTTVLYLELRVRKEGLDLNGLAKELGVGTPAGSPWPVAVPVAPGAPAATEEPATAESDEPHGRSDGEGD